MHHHHQPAPPSAAAEKEEGKSKEKRLVETARMTSSMSMSFFNWFKPPVWSWLLRGKVTPPSSRRR